MTIPDTTGRPASVVDQEVFRMLVDSVRDYAIFMLTPDGRVATWNAGAQAIKGYSAAEIIGQHFTRFYEPEAIARGWPDHELKLAALQGRFEDEGWRLRRDGSRFWASVVITALHDPSGELRGFAKVTRDLTSRRRLEDLQRSEQRMNEFLALLAHELRNPLTPMRTALDIAERVPGDLAIQELTRGIFSRQLSHLTRMVDDVLDLGRAATGKIRLSVETLDLAGLVREKVLSMQPSFTEEKRTLVADLPDEQVPVSGDATRVAQVLANLLGNALKFTQPGGRTVVSLHREGGLAFLTVADDGIGIEAHLLPRIFDAFVQGERGLDRAGGGLGLGLKLVKTIVEAHGGSVAGTSEGAGKGATFSVMLPIEGEGVRPHARQADRVASDPLRVLVVDDNEAIVESMFLLLRMLGHEVDAAADGPAAIQRVRIFHPDLVLLDIGLPGMDGYQAARAIRLIPGMRDAFLVACSGYDDVADRDRSQAAGIDQHVSKPVSVDTLQAILSHVATLRGARAAKARDGV